jgi:hypothetical protein
VTTRRETGTAAPEYGRAINYGRSVLAARGFLVPWMLTAEGHDSKHVLHRLRAKGEAVQIQGSTLHVRPDVAEALERVLEAYDDERRKTDGA